MKDDLGGKILTKFDELKARTYGYLVEDKKAKYTKVCDKKRLKFENYENCLEPTQLENKINDVGKNKMT